MTETIARQASDGSWAGVALQAWYSESHLMVRVATSKDRCGLLLALATGQDVGSRSLPAMRVLKDILDGMDGRPGTTFFLVGATRAMDRLATWRRVGGDLLIKEIQ